MKKRIISLLLCLCMVFSLLPTAVLAENGEDPDTSAGPGQVMQQNSEDLGDQSDSNDQSDSGDQSDQGDLPDSENSDDSDAPQLLGEGLGSALSGNCGATPADTVSWALTSNDDGRTYTLTISGDGAMADYYAQYVQRPTEFPGDIAPWRRALLSNPDADRTTDKVVPITEVEIGDGVTRIGSGAFAYTELTGTVTFSENVTSYGDGVFARDTSIKAVDWTNFKPTETIRDGWATVYTEEHIAVPYAFFDGCSSLDTSIVDGITYSGQLVLPDTIEAIYVAAFRGTGFRKVDFSDGLSSICAVGSYAITKLANMTEFTYPGNVDFYGVNVEGQNNVIQGGGIEKLTIAKEVTTLPVSFCTDTENLTAIEFESGSQLREIGKTAFYNTKALESIDIPSTVTSIGESAFANCFNLEKIELGQIESLGQNTFANCSSLETAKIQGSPNVIYPPNMFSMWTGYSAAPLKTLEIGAGSIQFGLNNQKDSIETVVLGDGVTEIPNHFAAGCTKLTSVSLPDALTSVPAYAFNGCSSLKKIGISEKSKLQSIGGGAFANSALTQIYIPKGVKSIGESAFNRTPITVFDMSDVLAESMEVGLYAINNWYDPDKPKDFPAWKDDFKYIYVSNSGAAASVKEKTNCCDYAFFVTNGGSVDATKTGFAAVYREGYTAKWYDNETCTGNPVAGKPENGKTYYVKWTAGEISGHCGAAGNEQNVRWVLADNGDGYTLSITGTGAMADYTCNITRSDATQPWRESETGVAPTAITMVVVGSGVTNIGEFACDGLSQVKEYNIAASVEDIGPWGVCGQNAVTYTLTGSTHYVVTPDGVLMSADGKTLVSYPGGKDAVDEYVIPETVETILAGAFVGSDAKKVVIPSSVTKFPRFSFGGSTVEEIEFNATVDTLEGGAFSGLSQLKSLVFGGTTLTTIRDQACSDLSSLTEITFPDSLTTIEGQAFKVLPEDGAAAPNLKKVTFGKGMSKIGDVVFLRQSALEVIDMTHCEDLTDVGLFNSRDFDGSEETPYKNTPIVYTANADVAELVKQSNGTHLIYAVTNDGTFPADTAFEAGQLAKPKKEGCLFLDWYADSDCSGEKVTTFEAGKTYYAKWMDHIPEPTNADFTKGLVTVKCLNRVACSDMQYGLNAAVAHNKYTMVQVSATEYSVTYDADAFAVNGHSLYSADTLTWTLTYEDGKWNLAPQTPGVDDVVLVTHAPTTLDEVTKFIDGRTDVIKTSCVNGETATCAYGLMVAFANPEHVVSVEQEKDSSGEPIRGSYIATLKIDQFAKACTDACNKKNFADSPRDHDVLSQNPVQWRFKVTQAEVSTDTGTGTEKQYVWSAEPVEAGKDDVCQVAHRVVLTFSYDQHGVMVDDTKVEYKYNTTEITDGTVPTPTREGYTFVRWLDADGNEFVPTAPVTEDHTYDTIEWTPINYSVIFDANAGGKTVTGTMGDQVFTYDQKQTLNANQFVCTDSKFDDRLKQDTRLYEFGGWNTAADGSGTPYTDKADFTNKSVKHGERITLYAQWKHVTKTLTYVSAQGPAPDVADVDIFTEVTVADAPANVEGYTFVGWRSDIDGLRETFKPGDKFVMPNTDVTLTAVWEEIVPDATYTVSTSVNGTMEQIAEGLKAGETYTINIDDPVKEGYRFTGWQVSPTGAVLKKGDTFNMPAGNVILTAQFQKIEKFTVTYQYDGVTAVGDTYEVGSVVTVMRNDPALNGSTFLYWRSSHEGQQLKKGDTFIMPNTNVVLTAVGQKNPTKYMVQFLVDGSLIGQETGIAGSFITLKPAQTKNGFTFVGWQSSVGEGKIYPANSRFEIPATTVKMTAVWQADPATYTVTYALNGGEGSASDSNAYVESAFVTVTDAAVTKAGFIFAGWRSSYGGAVYQANDTFQMPGTNVTLTAQWQPEEATYTVSTSVNGTLTQIANGKKANEVYTIAVDDPTLDGHTFTGWLLSSTGTIVNKGDTFNMPAGDVVLTAQFEKVETRTVTYQYGNVTSAAESFEVGSTVTVTRNNPTQNGKTFLYWRSSYEGKQLQKGDTFTMPNADVVLTAVWQENPTEYTVQFYVDGSLIGQEKGVAGSYVTLKPAPQAKDGYTFIGWQSSVGEGTVYPANSRFEVPATNVKMNAVWEKNSYTVTWKNDDGTILAKDTVEAGSTPEYVGAKPTKEATAETSYTFVGWDPEVAPVTEDVTYTAQFEGTVRTYTVKFYNADGTLLESKQVKYGVIPKLGREPKKEGDAQYSYKFKAWSPKLAPVTDDAEYYATYTKTINTYTVTWVIDGTSETQTYEYGKMPAHADPVKIATDAAVYTFEGWTPALSIVTGNVTYTAQFTETAKHTVSYNLNGGTPAFASAKYAEGEVVNTPADVPTKTGYVFTGWLISFENKTVNANGTFSMPNTDVTLTAQWRVAITGNVYIPAIDPVHGVHEQPYNAQFTAKKDNATGDPVAAGDVQFVLVDEDGHADTTRNIGHGLTLNVDGSITGTAMGAGEVPFRVKLANADGDFVSDEIFAFTIVIEKAPRTCTVTIADWTYGDKASEPVVTLSKTEVPETYTYYYKVKGAPDDTYTTTVPVDAGEYTLKAVVAETANYLSREATANFKILKKLIVSVDPAVTAPKACQMPQTTVTAEGYTGVITWAPADDTFKYSTVYTATVVLTPDSNHRFADSTTAENGWTKEAYDSAAGTLKLTKTFPKTAQDTVKTPVIKPNGGNFYGSQRVTITCATEGATIYYTTDGSTPTQSSKQYTEAFSITDDTTVKAIAVKANYNDSAVAEAEFTKRTGGGGGGTVVTPVKPSKKDNSLKFNTAEHFAYVNGYPDGTVKPTGDVTRAEVAAILYRVMDADCVKTYETTRCSFSDVVRGDWFNTYVATLENAGVIVDTRTNGKFRPNEAITRAELAAMLAQFADIKSAANSFNDVSARHWASDEIAVCAKMGWINGYPDGSFRPDATITRAEMMAMINRALDRTPKSVSDLLSGMKTWSDNANTGAWYYLDVQEATNSHTYMKSGTHETWKKLH